MRKTVVLSPFWPRVTWAAKGALVAALLGGAAQAQDSTLADIRQELSVLYVEVQKLKRELSTTGAPSTLAGQGSSVLDRLDAVEGALQHLTSKTERLEFRLERVVRDGSNQIGDMNFRLCEVEPNCNISDLPDLAPLGGVQKSQAPTPPQVIDKAELAVGEAADFEAAQAAFEAGNADLAVQKLDGFLAAYPGSPLTARAYLLHGQAHEAQGAIAPAARSYLESFSGAPTGPVAPRALFLLGAALGTLGQTKEACVTLHEVGVRYPDSSAAGDARTAREGLSCS